MWLCITTGYRYEQHNNPADFFLDVIIENEEANDDLKGIANVPSCW